MGQPWLKDKHRDILIAILFGSSSIVIGKLIYPSLRNSFYSILLGPDGRLPMGLHNNQNLCYLNSLLQAIAANHSLVKFLSQRAILKHDKISCFLAGILEGLRCPLNYLKNHNLLEALAYAHQALAEELTFVNKWIANEQQDVHELFTFLMNSTCDSKTDRDHDALNSASRILLSISSDSPLTANTDAYSTHCCYKNSLPALPLGSVNGTPFRASEMVPKSYQQLIVTQIFCKRCGYVGEIKFDTQSCLSVFPKNLSDKRSRGKSKESACLDELLVKQFRSVERLGGINCPRCHIKALQVPRAAIHDTNPMFPDKNAVKRLVESLCQNTCFVRRSVVNPPSQSLVLYIQRAIWTEIRHILPDTSEFVNNYSRGGCLLKFMNHVKFPSVVDLAPYVCSGKVFEKVLDRIKRPSFCPMHVNGSLKKNGVLETSNQKGKKNSRDSSRYALRSVVVHQGHSLHAGHYITYRRWTGGGSTAEECGNNDESSEWLRTSDRFVERVPLSVVMASQAYMLFYERLPETHSSSPTGSSNLAPSTSVDGQGGVFDIDNEYPDILERYSCAQKVRFLLDLAQGSRELD